MLPQETVFMRNSSNSFVDPFHKEGIYFTFPKNLNTYITTHAIIYTLKYKDMSGDVYVAETHDVKMSKFYKDDTLL